ncbi:MAG TPA: thiamine-phosphate kinase [Candidatus Baltobacteraceae bacterium]
MVAEDALIDALRALVERPGEPRVLLGIGDDAAVWQPSRSHRSVITTDALVEGVHFTRALGWERIGRRAMASNLSDIAAMGARPVLATIALGLPEIAQEDVLELYRGMIAVSADARCAIVGGDITRSPAATIAITVVGEVRPSNLKTRSGARPNDVLAVSGPLGASRAGLHGSADPEAVRAHGTPSARWREGLWFGASRNVHAMMDVSDGLSTDLTRLCRRSAVGAIVDDVPVAPSAAAMAASRGESPLDYALAGGEDFELLIAVDARAFAHLQARFSARFQRTLHRIGTVREGKELSVRKGSQEEALLPTGWDHVA